MSQWVNIIGPTNVGKSTLIQFLKNGAFPQMRRSSALQDFYRYKFRIDKRDLALDLCDNPSQAEYRRLIWAAARNCKAFILMFDLSSSLSFEEAKQWLAELRQNLSSEKNIIFAIGNKKDLDRQLDKDYINSFWEEEGIEYIEISIRNGQNTKKKVDKLLRQIWLEINYKISVRLSQNQSIRLQSIKERKKKKECC